jgi:hypothetical protein
MPENNIPVFNVRNVAKEWAQDNVTDELVGGVTPEFRLTKKTDDPMGITRVSLGGNLTEGQYLVYKGELDVVEELLRKSLAVVKAKIKSLEKQQSNLIIPDGQA